MNAADKGSEFAVDASSRIIKFKLRGLWQEQQLKTFCDGLRESIAKLGAGPFCVYADIVDYPAQRPEIGKGAQQMMAYAASAGMVKAAHVVNAVMTEIQVKRLAKEVNAPNFRFFRTEKEAMEWLSEK
jgi:hypothetical protein